jgi:hypothetical protein
VWEEQIPQGNNSRQDKDVELDHLFPLRSNDLQDTQHIQKRLTPTFQFHMSLLDKVGLQLLYFQRFSYNNTLSDKHFQ